MKALANSRLALVFLALGALAAAGAALAFASAAGGAGDGVSTIALRDGEIALEDSTLEPGRHVIEAVNEGTTEHELVVLRTDTPVDELPVGLHGVSISQAGGELVVGEDHVASRHEHEPGEVLGLLPGRSRRTQVELEPGTYVVYCQTGSHYLAGERTSFTVE